MKAILGVLCIIFSLYFYMGNPELDRWPMFFGETAVNLYKFLIDARPYTQILLFVFGVAFLVTIKKL